MKYKARLASLAQPEQKCASGGHISEHKRPPLSKSLSLNVIFNTNKYLFEHSIKNKRSLSVPSFLPTPRILHLVSVGHNAVLPSMLPKLKKSNSRYPRNCKSDAFCYYKKLPLTEITACSWNVLVTKMMSSKRFRQDWVRRIWNYCVAESLSSLYRSHPICCPKICLRRKDCFSTDLYHHTTWNDFKPRFLIIHVSNHHISVDQGIGSIIKSMRPRTNSLPEDRTPASSHFWYHFKRIQCSFS